MGCPAEAMAQACDLLPIFLLVNQEFELHMIRANFGRTARPPAKWMR